MGEQRHNRTAVDAQGNTIAVIEWRGDHGTAHMHDDADLKDPQFYSRFTMLDAITKLLLQADKRTLLDPESDKIYTLL